MTLLNKIILTTVAAGAILVVAILPAEYGIDPTGLGSTLGLVNIAKNDATETKLSQEKNTNRFDAQDLTLSFNIGEYDPTAERINESVQGLIHLEDMPFKSETFDIEIEDYGEIEHKFIMPADSTFVYSWEVLNPSGEGVYYDFHGHPSSQDATNYPEGFEMAYARGEGTTQSGAFTTPFAGYHGFYFMNIEQGPITVRVTVSGYWKEHKEMFRAVDGKVITKVPF